MISAAPNMLDPENVAELIKAIRAAGVPTWIILDTWAQVTAGANENDGAGQPGQGDQARTNIVPATGRVRCPAHPPPG